MLLRSVFAASAVAGTLAFALAGTAVYATPTPPPVSTATARIPLPGGPPKQVQLPRFLRATFDDVAVGVVDTSYQGITFACPGCGTAHAYAALQNPLVNTPQNHVVSPFAGNILPYFDERSGVIQATFAQACTSVSVNAQPVLGVEGLGSVTNRPYLKAFAANGQQVGATVYGTPPGTGDAGAPVWQELAINATASAPIASIRFSVEHTSGRPVQAMFDNVICTY
jgi:hypothetical protein